MSSLVSAGPCNEASELRRERIEYDIAMRKKRIELRQAVIDFKTRDNEYEKKLAEIQERVLGAKGDEVDALWKQYDLISTERDALTEKADEISRKYSQISFERARVKMDMKYRQMKKRYECVLDGELDAKLADIVKNIANKKGLASADVEIFESLVRQRGDELKSVQQDYDRYLKEVESWITEYKSINERISQYAMSEDALYNERDKIYDRVDELSSAFGDKLGKLSERLDEISPKLLGYIEKFK